MIWHFYSFKYRISQNSTRKMISLKKTYIVANSFLKGEQQFHVANLKLSHTEVWNTHQNSFTFKCQSTIFLFVGIQQLREKRNTGNQKIFVFRFLYVNVSVFPVRNVCFGKAYHHRFHERKKNFSTLQNTDCNAASVLFVFF